MRRAHQRYVAVVPGVVIDQSGAVRHACYLVAVVPPRHHPHMLVCVLPQPIVRLPEVVQDVTCPTGGGRGGLHVKRCDE